MIKIYTEKVGAVKHLVIENGDRKQRFPIKDVREGKISIGILFEHEYTDPMKGTTRHDWEIGVHAQCLE